MKTRSLLDDYFRDNGIRPDLVDTVYANKRMMTAEEFEKVTGISRIMDKWDAEIDKFTFVRHKGVEYDICKNGWLTISAYIKSHDLKSVNVVMNWIKRGVVPAECVVRIPELNNLCLVRDLVYEVRSSTV